MVRGESLDEGVFEGQPTLVSVSGVDVRSLPIGPTEAFVLSRIDGPGTVSDLVIATGLPVDEVQAIVTRLIALGAVQILTKHSLIVPAPSSLRSGEHSIPLAVQNQEAVDLSLEHQHLLLDLDRRLSTLSHYQLLDVEPSADSKQIRAAYYERVR